MASTDGRGEFAVCLAPIVFPNQTGQPQILGIDPGSDTGLSNTDGITNDKTPYVDGLSEQTAFGNVAYITLYDMSDPAHPRYIGGFQGSPTDPANLANTAIQTDSAGHFKVQITGALTDGVKTIGVQATNESGTKGNIATFQFTLDTVIPQKPFLPILLPVSDTGLESNDQITKLNSNLQFQIGFNNILGGQVTLYRGTTMVGVPTIGVPDANTGEAVKLFVVRKDPNLTVEQMTEYCKEQLTAYKKPKYIEFRTELPKSNVGKILRRELRDEKKAA